MRQKGFVISISTLLIFIVILWFSAFYSEKVEREETNIYESFGIEKAGFVADDVIYDINRLLGTGVDVNRGNKFMAVGFYDKIPADINKMQLLDLNNFLDGNYSGKQNAEINLELSKLLDGKTELKLSNGLEYDYAYRPDQNFVQLRSSNGSNTGIFTYDIVIYVDGGRLDSATAWTCDTLGDVNVGISYSDSFAESDSTPNCEQNSTGTYTYTYTFQGNTGSLIVNYGNFDGNVNSVRIKNTIENPNIDVYTSIEAELDAPSKEVIWFYDADLNYVQTDVNLNRKIELGSS